MRPLVVSVTSAKGAPHLGQVSSGISDRFDISIEYHKRNKIALGVLYNLDMKLLKIAVGTTSETKLACLQEVLAAIGLKAKVISLEVKSGVADQPISEAETQKGSVNRAKAALKAKPEADFGLGIEVGYHPNQQGNYEMFCCAAIVGQNSFTQACLSSRFFLPAFHQQVLKEGKYLGEYVRQYQEGVDEPVVNYVRELVRGRKPLIVEATRNALLTYLEQNK